MNLKHALHIKKTILIANEFCKFISCLECNGKTFIWCVKQWLCSIFKLILYTNPQIVKEKAVDQKSAISNSDVLKTKLYCFLLICLCKIAWSTKSLHMLPEFKLPLMHCFICKRSVQQNTKRTKLCHFSNTYQ